MMEPTPGGPVADLLGEMARIVDAYKAAPPTSARTARIVVPTWFSDEDMAEAQRLADEVARAYGFKDARIEKASGLPSSHVRHR